MDSCPEPGCTLECKDLATLARAMPLEAPTARPTRVSTRRARRPQRASRRYCCEGTAGKGQSDAADSLAVSSQATLWNGREPTGMVAYPALIGALERDSDCESAAGPGQYSGDIEDGIQGTVASITPGAHWLGARSCAGLHVRFPGGQASRPLCRVVKLIQGAVGRPRPGKR